MYVFTGFINSIVIIGRVIILIGAARTARAALVTKLADQGGRGRGGRFVDVFDVLDVFHVEVQLGHGAQGVHIRNEVPPFVLHPAEVFCSHDVSDETVRDTTAMWPRINGRRSMAADQWPLISGR
jgi:hypothetical protein